MPNKIPMLLLVGIVVLGIYILPNVIATFSGSHTMEYNVSAGVGGLACDRCHTYIYNELNLSAGSNSEYVLQQHMTASNNPAYVNVSGTGNRLRIANVSGGTVTGACQICHLMEQDAINIAGTHTKITIRTCTDIDCHGNSTADTGSSEHTTGTGINLTYNLSRPADAHSSWYEAMEAQTSTLEREDGGGNYSTGFYACMGCHAHVEMNMNISRPKAFNINITINESGTFIEGPAINYTSPNTTITQRSFGSVWS